MITVAFPLSALAITISVFDLRECSASFPSLVMLAGGGFALRRMLKTAARAVFLSTPSGRFSKAGLMLAIMS